SAASSVARLSLLSACCFSAPSVACACPRPSACCVFAGSSTCCVFAGSSVAQPLPWHACCVFGSSVAQLEPRLHATAFGTGSGRAHWLPLHCCGRVVAVGSIAVPTMPIASAHAHLTN